MSQKSKGKGNQRFERMARQQRYGETQQKYEEQAVRILMMLLGFWSLMWLLLGLVIPQAALWFFIAWAIGSSAFSAGMVKIRSTKKASRAYLETAKPLAALYAMNPLDFEHAVAQKFRDQGFEKVQVTPSMGDGGIDIFMEKAGKRYGVQCKKYHPESYVKIDELRAFVYAIQRASCGHGIFVTTANFGAHGRKEMEEQGIVLIDGKKLVQ